MRRPEKKGVPSHHRKAIFHMQSGIAALQQGNEAMAKSHLGHALRTFSGAGQTMKPPMEGPPMPQGEVD